MFACISYSYKFSLAQCPNGDVYLSRQSEINSFATDYPGCSIISGTLYLGDFGFGTDVVDLSPLSALTSLAGLSVTGTAVMDDLDGLHNLTAISGPIVIEKNIELDDLHGLSFVSGLVKSISIIGNPELADLFGLSNTLLDDGDLIIKENHGMISLDGLGAVPSAQQVSIANNDLLADISALSTLEKAESVLLTDLLVLTNLDGLDKLTYVGNTLEIKNLSTLSGLDALSKLEVVEDNLNLIRLPLIQNLTGLESLNTSGALTIHTNDALENMFALNQLTKVDDLSIMGNMELKNLKGLQQISELQNLKLQRNVKLESVEGLEGLEKVYEDFEVVQNVSLIDVKYLGRLTNIDGDVVIKNNDELVSLEGFENAALAGQALTISDNKNLVICGVRNVCAFLSATPAKAIIFGNGANCGTSNEVISVCGLVALPVEITSFELAKENADARLTWVTASEYNNRGFEIERSEDGKTWETIAWVESKGAAQSQTTYEYLDSPKSLGTVYYRLNQIDQSGSEKESKVNSLNFGYIESNLSVFPNPAVDMVTIDYQVAEGLAQGVEIRLFNLTGQLCKSIWIDQPGQIDLNIEGLSSGLYLLKANGFSSFLIVGPTEN